MIRKNWPLLALSMTLATAANPASPDALGTIRQGTYAHSARSIASAKLLDWNIDRGKHFDRIAAAIRDQRPDLCLFQEVDLGARRSRGRDVARDLAQGFGMNYVFAVEFNELSQRTAEGPAYHGQAILTSLPIRSSRILRFAHQSGFWAPHRLLISGLPILQRRIGGRIALVSELDNGGKPLAVYDLHLESRGDEQLRLLQMEEVMADAQRYPAQTPVIVAGDFNTKSRRSPLIPRLREAGYRSCFGDQRIRTHVLIGALDWIFVRGPIECEGARVHREIHGSDHFPISAGVRF